MMMGLIALVVATCRTVYCWMFLFWSVIAIYVAYSDIQHSAQTHSVDRSVIFSSTIMAAYSLVLGIAWWMVFRGKAALKRWAIGANLIFILNYLPALVIGNWHGVLEAELEWWPVIFVGVLGIIVFSIPYHGLRKKAAGDRDLDDSPSH
jgi:hypothetical protein